jgi:hypothetical protein
MYIHEAVEKAMKTGKGITRQDNELFAGITLIPTNSAQGFICVSTTSMRLIPRWQPCAEDLLSGGWIVTGEE